MKSQFKRVWRMLFWYALVLSCAAVVLLLVETRHSAAWSEDKRQQKKLEVMRAGMGTAAIACISAFGWWWCRRNDLMRSKQQDTQETTEQKHD